MQDLSVPSPFTITTILVVVAIFMLWAGWWLILGYGRDKTWRKNAGRDTGLADIGHEALFRVTVKSLQPLNAAADAVLSVSKLKDVPVVAICKRLFPKDAAMVASRIEALVATGLPFDLAIPAEAGRHYSIRGKTYSAEAIISILDVSEWHGAERIAQQDLEVLRTDLAVRTEALSVSMGLMWRLDADGALDWTNAAGSSDRTRQAAQLISEVKRLGADINPQMAARVALPGDVASQTAGKRWFTVRCAMDSHGGQIFTALPMDDVIKAEDALARFVETLTETFAHLPTGLAIFDRDRSLGLFNPALCDHLGVDAAWLAARPSLGAFFDRLRETRMIPEQQSFAGWRDQFLALQESAEGDTYNETWSLAEGRTLRVRGRAHPHGAIAFLFDDITNMLSLEMQYRDALNVRDAALMRLPIPVGVFDTAGKRILGTARGDEDKKTDETDIAGQAERWARQYGASEIWRRLIAYVRQAGPDREILQHRLNSEKGAGHTLSAAPLPGGGTVVSLSPTALPTPAEAPRKKHRPDDGLLQRLILDALDLASDADVHLIVAPVLAKTVNAKRPELLRALFASLITAALSEIAPAAPLRVTLSVEEGEMRVRLGGLSQSKAAGVVAADASRAFHKLLQEAGGTLTLSNGTIRKQIECRIPLMADIRMTAPRRRVSH